jgi:predicted Rossmann-fold nucleotide-binding protein
VFDGIECLSHGVPTVSAPQTRKRALIEEADCVIVLPGGPGNTIGERLRIMTVLAGTWDELFEVAVERVLKFSTQPLCVINIDGYYNGVCVGGRC